MALSVTAIVGHSNAFGLAGWVNMLLEAPHLRPVSLVDPTKIVWKNILVFTSAHGYSGAGGTPPTHTESEGEWLEMTTNNPASPAAPHPHPSPFAYPNVVGIPLPNYQYDAAFEPGVNRGLGTMAGIETAGLMWNLSNYLGATVGLIKMAAPGSLWLRYDEGAGAELIFGSPTTIPTPESQLDLSEGYYNWYTPADRFDWSQSTGRLYQSFLTKCIAAKAARSDMSIDRVVMWFGDNDSNRTRERVQFIEDYARKWIKKFRQDLVDNELTTKPGDQVQIALMGICEFYDGIVAGTPQGNPDFINAAFRRIADDDPYIRFIDTNDYDLWNDDPGHFNAAGYIAAAQDVFDAFVEMDVDPYDSMDLDELLTVAQVKERVRIYYTRGKVQTDLSNDVLLTHINAAMHHIVHQCSDMAYWLRRRTNLTLSGSGNLDPITLPKQVHRVLHIESLHDATYPLHYEMVGHTGGGKVQVVLKNAGAGTYIVHYIRLPRDLTLDAEKVPLPAFLMEWLVVEVCFRIARGTANPVMLATYQGESMRLETDVLKNLAATYRAKRNRIYTQRRLPDVLNRRYRQWEHN